MDELQVRRAVRDHYGGQAGDCGCGTDASGCCAPGQGSPAGPKLGVGNPVEVAALKPGETVLDLGSGPGTDVLEAAARVGPQGRAIGVDATPEMVYRAREAARDRGLANVEFRLGEIEQLPVESASVDVVLSDCVINLSPDKARVFREAFRVLRPGGRIVVSDVVADRELPEAVRRDASAWAACVAGAESEAAYVRHLEDAGFEEIRTVRRGSWLASLGTAVVTARKAASRT